MKLLYPDRRKYFFLLIFPLLVFNQSMVEGQQTNVLLFHAVILDAGSKEPLDGAHFIAGTGKAGAADEKGMVSFYAYRSDTVRFSCVGYKDTYLYVSDTLFAREYTAGIFMSADTLQIPGIVVVPRLGNIRAEILGNRSLPDQEKVNAINNLKISTYQGLTGVNRLGDPAANYELIRQQQRIDAYEKGGIPSDKMISLSPVMLIPIIYTLAKGLPETPDPPQPYLSPVELQRIRTMHDSLVYKTGK